MGRTSFGFGFLPPSDRPWRPSSGTRP